MTKQRKTDKILRGNCTKKNLRKIALQFRLGFKSQGVRKISDHLKSALVEEWSGT